MQNNECLDSASLVNKMGGPNNYNNWMTLLKTATLAVLFGSLYTIFRKYQSVIDLPSQSTQFNQPLLQSFLIFLGMSSITFFTPWMSEGKDKKVLQAKPQDNKFLYIMPSLLDVLGTIVDTAGLFYTSVSISQMLKGSVLFFTYLITIFVLKRKITFTKHLYMLVILFSLLIIGSSNLKESTSKFESNPAFGNVLIILSQFLFSLMFIYQQKILRQYEVKVENAVFWQGIWGALLSGLALIVFSSFENPINPNLLHSCLLICNNKELLFAVFMTAACIGPFNYFGISLTQQESALQRCMICTSRMIIVWMISLIFGWQQFHLTQLIGYLLLTWGIYQFNYESPPQIQNAEVIDQQAYLQDREVIDL